MNEPIENKEKKVGLFFDFANAVNGYIQLFGCNVNHAVLAQLLITMAKKYGRLVSARAYLPFDKARQKVEDVEIRNIYERAKFFTNLVTPKQGPGGDGTDNILSNDILRHLGATPKSWDKFEKLDIFIVVTGDKDYFDALKDVKLEDKEVVIITYRGNKAPSLYIIQSGFIFLDEYVEQLKGKKIDVPKYQSLPTPVPTEETLSLPDIPIRDVIDLITAEINAASPCILVGEKKYISLKQLTRHVLPNQHKMTAMQAELLIDTMTEKGFLIKTNICATAAETVIGIRVPDDLVEMRVVNS